MEHLVGKQSQSRVAQVHVMHQSDRKGWSQHLTLPRLHLRVGSGRGGSLWSSLLPWGLLRVIRFFFLSFLCPRLLYLGFYSLAVAWDFAALLSLLCFIVLWLVLLLTGVKLNCCRIMRANEFLSASVCSSSCAVHLVLSEFEWCISISECGKHYLVKMGGL